MDRDRDSRPVAAAVNLVALGALSWAVIVAVVVMACRLV